MDIYKCDTCKTERSLEDKRIIKVINSEGKPTMRDVETCVFCIARGLVITENLVKVQEVETKEKAG